VESKIPYLAVFAEVDKLLGSSLHLQRCPLDARQLFRPVQVIGAWQLEAAAGSIAQKICLRLPSVNFYAIAQRCLKELSLPVEKILPHACRIYEWTMPAELWLSSNPARVPTRVCVMAILVVTLRVLYNINGQGFWEVSLPQIPLSLCHLYYLINANRLLLPKKSKQTKFCFSAEDL
jgi:hypothetical protein